MKEKHEIKFRAKYQDKWYFWDNLRDKEYILKFILNPEIYIGVQIMQSTGLKDRDGEEIYEGDIVRQSYSVKEIDYETIAIIQFSRGSFIGYSQELNQYFQPAGYFEDCKIIGNIYNSNKSLKEAEELYTDYKKYLEIDFLEHIKQMLIAQDTIRKSDSRPVIRTIQDRIKELKKGGLNSSQP